MLILRAGSWGRGWVEAQAVSSKCMDEGHRLQCLTSCPKDELHQWFIGLYVEHIIPAIVYRYTQFLLRPDLITLDKNGNSHPLMSNESVARVFKRLADRLQGVVSDTSMLTITLLTFWRSTSRKQMGLNLPVIESVFSCCLYLWQFATWLLQRYVHHIYLQYISNTPRIYTQYVSYKPL